jgi:CHAD domain-containing protein
LECGGLTLLSPTLSLFQIEGESCARAAAPQKIKMAKSKEITGLNCEDSAAVGIRLVLFTRFEEMCALREAALDWSDIEGVHDMRVASRRLRSALRDFLPFVQKRSLKNVRDDLKKIADALGAVRDQDVAIAALEYLKEESEQEDIKSGIEKLIEERSIARDEKRMVLIETITIGMLSLLQEKFNQALEKATKETHSISFREVGRGIIELRLEEFLKLSRSLYAPFNVKPLHNLRIAAKRLRYAIELFAICFGDEIIPFAEEVTEMQTSLGELHDCDVWIEELGKKLLKSENENKNPATVWLLSHYTKTRTKHYRAALERWQNWVNDSFAERLIEAVES